MSQASATAAEMVRDSMPQFPPDGALHDPEVFLLDFVPPECRLEVVKPFAEGFANCFDIVQYLLKQQQTPKPRLVGQMAGVVPGLDKR